MPSLKIIDTYHGNSATVVAAALAVSDGVIAKATEGQRSVDVARLGTGDSSHDGTVALARQTGKLVGHYHFGWLGLPVATQVAHFLAVAKPQPGDVVALDCERYAGATPPAGQWLSSPLERLIWVLAFVAGVNQATGARCWLYANRSELAALRSAAAASGRLAAFTAIPKWVADPDHPAGHPDYAYPWVCHQYSTAGGIDRDYFAGDIAAWRALGVPAPVVTPPPVVEPLTGAPAPNPTTLEEPDMVIIQNSATHAVYAWPTMTPLDGESLNGLRSAGAKVAPCSPAVVAAMLAAAGH